MANTKRLLRSTTGRNGTPPILSRAGREGLPRRRPEMPRFTWSLTAGEPANNQTYASMSSRDCSEAITLQVCQMPLCRGILKHA